MVVCCDLIDHISRLQDEEKSLSSHCLLHMPKKISTFDILSIRWRSCDYSLSIVVEWKYFHIAILRCYSHTFHCESLHKQQRRISQIMNVKIVWLPLNFAAALPLLHSFIHAWTWRIAQLHYEEGIWRRIENVFKSNDSWHLIVDTWMNGRLRSFAALLQMQTQRLFALTTRELTNWTEQRTILHLVLLWP